MPNRYRAGDKIGSYTVVDRLGKGDMGAVLRVKDLFDDEYALKYCTHDDAEALRRFAREVRAMQKVKHQNVMEVLDHDLEHAPPYFVMPMAKTLLDAEIPNMVKDHELALEAFIDFYAGVTAVHSIGSLNPRPRTFPRTATNRWTSWRAPLRTTWTS